MGFFSRNNSTEYKKLEEYSIFINDLLNKDDYLSRKDYYDKLNELSDMIKEIDLMEKNNVLKDYCKKEKLDYKKFKALIDTYKGTNNIINKHNDLYVSNHLVNDKDYLDKVLLKDDPNIILDKEQREAVLCDEDYMLIIAGAGTGKTTAIEAKAKYLVDNKNVDPNRILIVSFTKEATDELKKRCKKLNLSVNISTFHSIGYSIINNNSNEKHNVVEQKYMYKEIERFLVNKLDDDYFIKKILLFFASYLNMPFGLENSTLLYKTLAANDVTTLRSDLSEMLDKYHKEQTKNKVTIKAERVRSIDECRIANFLFINGIDYVYEPVYKYGFKNSTKPYCPDFLIKYEGKEIYLEHFGLSDEGINNRFNDDEIKRYKASIKDKIELHKEHGTKLIYTFSKYKDGKDLITHLKELLENNGIKLNPVSSIEIYKELAHKAEDRYFHKLIQLICSFINRFKVCNYDLDTKFDEWQYSVKNERTKLFLEIVKICFHAYEKKKAEDNAIDFEDMINYAINILDKKIETGEKLPFDYIFVDEYQDVSLQRFNLCEKLSKASDAKIIAVGDDWQAIYRFSGAQIDLFTNFEEKLGYGKVLKITNTYRNAQELIDIVSEFVMKNNKQIPKSVKSKKTIKDPVIIMSYDDTYDKNDKLHGPLYRLGEAIIKSLDDVVSNCGLNSEVFLIGRYNFEESNLLKLDEFFTQKNNRLIAKKYPSVKISFLTAHASKGLSCGNVIVINGKDDILGFPSKIEDDPVMKLVIKEADAIDFDEERRLFYVALTRTKNRVYLITPQTRPSKFITELKENFNTVTLRGVELKPNEFNNIKYKCPICGYPLQKRQTNIKLNFGLDKVWICSNDPELCGFLTNDLNGNKYKLSITKCEKCYDGYLVVKGVKNSELLEKYDRILGCTNYKSDGTGCNNSRYPYNFTQDKNKMIITDSGKVIVSEVKSKVNELLHSIGNIYNKIPNFKFSFFALSDFLIGNENKIITSFKLNNEEGFGLLSSKDINYIHSLLNILIDLDVIQKVKNKKGFEDIILNQKELDDNQAFIINSQLG